jgi:hypothetical protein
MIRSHSFFKFVTVLSPLGIGLIWAAVQAQTIQGRNQGGLDGEVPTPTLSQSTVASQDSTAIAELKAYEKVTGLSGWSGMQASGTTTYVDAPELMATTLSMLPGNRVKLSVTSSKGNNVTVTNGDFGHVHYAGASDSRLPALAIVGGLIPFDLPAFVVNSPTSFSIIDQGTVTLSGEALHRVTVERVINHRDGGVGGDQRAPVDLYFDPSTHLLRKSAALFMLPSAGRHRFVRVLTYANYTASGSTQIPHLISETLDGQATWSLQLSSVSLTAPAADNIF